MMGIKSFLIFILFISLLIFFYPVLGNCKNISPSYQNSIGDNYFFGKNGVNKNYVKAVRLYNKAAAQGYAPSESNLGWAYFSGKGVQQNYSKAVYWYKKAALQGYIQAEINLGAAYNHGKGVKINYSKAVYWFKMASHKEIKIAGTFLGNAYFYGKGVPKNYTKAVYWYKKAAMKGFAPAENNLAYAYEHGLGVKQNYIKAAYWYKKAAAQGDNYLFSLLKEAQYQKNEDLELFRILYLLPNITRRFLEGYFGLRYPNGKKLKNQIDDSKFFKKEDKEKLLKIFDEYSHEESVEHALKFPNASEIKEIVDIVLIGLKDNDQGHYDALCESCN